MECHRKGSTIEATLLINSGHRLKINTHLWNRKRYVFRNARTMADRRRVSYRAMEEIKRSKTNKKEKVFPPRADTVTQCPPHRWRIDEPNGSKVNGVCKKCGKTRTFNTTDKELDFLLDLEP